MNERKLSEAIELCKIILSDRARFDEEERDYKLEIAERVRATLDTAERGEDFFPLLIKVFDPPNNLLFWRTVRQFIDWVVESTQRAREGLQLLADEDLPLEERIDEFLDSLPRDGALYGHGTRAALASMFLMGLNPATYPMFRSTPFKRTEGMLDWPKATSDAAAGAIYAHHLAFARWFMNELQEAGLGIKDMLDVQSLIWVLANDKRPMFAAWRDEPTMGEEKPWLKPLVHPPGVEEELQKILAAGSSEDTREILAGIFRRAILLHQRTGTNGFLGARSSDPFTFSIMVGNLWACGAGGIVFLLVDDNPYLRAAYETGESERTDNELMWIHVAREPSELQRMLEDEEVWAAYERMLSKFPVFPRAQSNQYNFGKISVLTGERLGEDELEDLVSQFLEERGYPTDRDKENLAAREEFAEYLSPDAISNLDWDKFILIYQSNKYGRTGGMPGLNRYISGTDEEGLEKLRQAVEHLLYAELPFERRLDDVLTGEFEVSNFKEAVATKLLSICYPDKVLPIFVFRGPKGKAALMSNPALGLDVPESGSSSELAIRSNDLLRERLAPYFGNDTNEMKEFLYWLHWREDENGSPEDEKLAALAEELLLDKVFLEEVVALLRDKKQIIFYGPPGTGKTYIARKLVEHLASEVGRHEIVQFHPSYSYEDFVQGYRPVILEEDGGLTYDLKPGPLQRLARRARESAKEHVLLIDEINRGNLPKILGELLYLLEYREDEVTLMYEEDGERFTMPENLLIIGTMNTADRSIALVDAALRRRFHFVPLFPGQYPLDGLLSRWLKRNNRDMVHVADIVERLNARLNERFGPHLQVGPSYFMDNGFDPLSRTDQS